jgi:hypothetical protein
MPPSGASLAQPPGHQKEPALLARLRINQTSTVVVDKSPNRIVCLSLSKMAGRQSGHWRKTGKRTTCPPGGRRIIRVLRVMMHPDPDSLKASCRSLWHTPKLACPVFHKALTSQFASRTTRQANHWSQMSSTQKPLKPWWGDGPRPTREEMDRRADEAYVSCAQCRLKGSIPNLFPTLCHTVRLSASRM